MYCFLGQLSFSSIEDEFCCTSNFIEHKGNDLIGVSCSSKFCVQKRGSFFSSYQAVFHWNNIQKTTSSLLYCINGWSFLKTQNMLTSSSRQTMLQIKVPFWFCWNKETHLHISIISSWGLCLMKRSDYPTLFSCVHGPPTLDPLSGSFSISSCISLRFIACYVSLSILRTRARISLCSRGK